MDTKIQLVEIYDDLLLLLASHCDNDSLMALRRTCKKLYSLIATMINRETITLHFEGNRDDYPLSLQGKSLNGYLIGKWTGLPLGEIIKGDIGSVVVSVDDTTRHTIEYKLKDISTVFLSIFYGHQLRTVDLESASFPYHVDEADYETTIEYALEDDQIREVSTCFHGDLCYRFKDLPGNTPGKHMYVYHQTLESVTYWWPDGDLLVYYRRDSPKIGLVTIRLYYKGDIVYSVDNGKITVTTNERCRLKNSEIRRLEFMVVYESDVLGFWDRYINGYL